MLAAAPAQRERVAEIAEVCGTLKMNVLPAVLMILASTGFDARQSRCEKGSTADCRAVASAYAEGKGVRKDLARAAEYEVLARRGQTEDPPPVCAHCNVCQDPAACQSICETHTEDPFACYLVAKQALVGRDLKKAAKFGELACGKGIAPGCALAGTIAMGTMGVPEDVSMAERMLDRGCELHDPAACGTAGLLYVSGQLFKKDEARGARMLGEACAEGYSPGCATLGQAYENGAGVPQDEARAVEIYIQGCNGGPRHWPSAHACSQVAELYDGGKWIRGDRAKAIEFYGKACEAGDQPACGRLSELRAQGATKH